jgi:hypothetical protein
VALVRNDDSDKRIVSIIKAKRIKEIGTTLNADVVSGSLIQFTLMMETLRFSETSYPTRATRRHIPGDGILHSHRRENFETYIALTGWAL